MGDIHTRLKNIAGACIGASLLAACGGNASLLSSPPSVLKSTIATHTVSSTAWALPEAKTSDLLYVATGDNVYFLTYPGGKPVGALGISAAGICTDKQGNVYVPGGDIVVYAHGEAIPKRVLKGVDPATACAVDPTTGNLAVMAIGSGTGYVGLYPNAQEPEQGYVDPDISLFGLCGYDDRGNLFADGTGVGNTFAELPKGSNTFVNYTLDYQFDFNGGIQWDGTFITLTRPSEHKVYRLSLSGSILKIVGTTRFHGWQGSKNGSWPPIQTWVRHDTFIGQSSTYADVGLWPYPAGRNPKRVISGFRSGTVTVYGIVLSLAKP